MPLHQAFKLTLEAFGISANSIAVKYGESNSYALLQFLKGKKTFQTDKFQKYLNLLPREARIYFYETLANDATYGKGKAA